VVPEVVRLPDHVLVVGGLPVLGGKELLRGRVSFQEFLHLSLLVLALLFLGLLPRLFLGDLEDGVLLHLQFDGLDKLQLRELEEADGLLKLLGQDRRELLCLFKLQHRC
jgi:hypothetical protein